jgi:hypothetical protein
MTLTPQRSSSILDHIKRSESTPSISHNVSQRLRETHDSAVAKRVWNLLLEAASGVSGRPDDTAAAVTTWSFLHGYAVLEHSGAFGISGPRGALEHGLTAFLTI